MGKPLNFVQKRGSDENCWVRHRPARKHVGNGLCQECEDIVAREGLTVPDRVRGDVENAPKHLTAAMVAAPKALATEIVGEAPPPVTGALSKETVGLIKNLVAGREIQLAQLKQLAGLIPLTSQEAVDDAKKVLDNVHVIAKQMRAFLTSYEQPLKDLADQYRELLMPIIREAEVVKADLGRRIGEAITAAAAGQQQALETIETAAHAGQPIPDSAITAAQGISVPGQRKTLVWRFAQGRDVKDLLRERPDLMIPNRAAIDGLLRIVGVELSLHTKGVLEAYEQTIVAAAKAT